MVLGLGVDVCPISRMRRAVDRHGRKFTGRVFTDDEIAFSGIGPLGYQRLAARFAAKEAAVKALGAPIGIGWKDVAVARSESAPPSLVFSGAAAKRAEALGVSRTHLSLTHAADVAVAVVILEGDA